MKVLLDTNFFLLPNQFGIDIFEELVFYELFTLSSCMDELKKIAKGGGKEGKAAKIGMKLAEMHKLDTVKVKVEGDDAIMDYAGSGKCIVATNDKELIRKLKAKGVRIIRMKQKKMLVED